MMHADYCDRPGAMRGCGHRRTTGAVGPRSPEDQEVSGADADVVAVGAVLSGLTPPRVRAGVRPVSAADVEELYPEEMAAIVTAVESRRSQFASGRALLRELIGTQVPLPVGPDRRPVLPVGTIASLAHDFAIAVAVAADRRDVGGLGVDVEPIVALDVDVAAAILRRDDDGVDPLLAFVAKEAVYKAWSGVGRPILEHHDVRLRSVGGGLEGTTLPDGSRFRVNVGRAAGRWLAVAVRRA
jgi:4'-phosphopantetheinyl transferase EntD